MVLTLSANKKATDMGQWLACWRRGPESNRPTRICNPVHNRFATAPCSDKKGKRLLPFLAGRCWRVFLNLERETRLELATSTLARLRSTN